MQLCFFTKLTWARQPLHIVLSLFLTCVEQQMGGSHTSPQIKYCLLNFRKPNWLQTFSKQSSVLWGKCWEFSASTAWPQTDMPQHSLGSSQHWSGDGASGFCTAAKSVGCYWYPISSVTPKLLCIQRLCAKPTVSSLWPVIVTIRLAVLLHNNHRVLYYPGNKSITSATLGAVQPWHFNCASFILGRTRTNLATSVKFLTH